MADDHRFTGVQIGGGGVHRGLAGAVRVDDPAALLAEPLDQLGRAGFAADRDRAQLGQGARGAGQGHRGGRRQEDVGDPGVPQPCLERLAQSLVLLRDVQLSARDPGEEQVGHGHVEAERHELQDAVLRGHREHGADVHREIEQRPVLDRHALGDAGGAGGVEDVGEVVGRTLHGDARSHGIRGFIHGLVRRLVRVRVHPQLRNVRPRQARRPRRRQQQRRARVRDHEGEARGGVCRVQRHIGAARAQHREGGDA
ncbi:hypothetical protein, partial [Streptomyces sp. T21Q-yed]|uniref:hypothetical protein n=1 Tax=Streptomyces sp. T21Q-yed TaxID=3018441 RepID=UPI0023DFA3CE